MINSESPIVMNGSVLYLLPSSRDLSISNKGIPKTRSLSDLEMVPKTPSEDFIVDRRNSMSGALSMDSTSLSTASAVEALVGPFKTMQEAQLAASLLKYKTSDSGIPATVNLCQKINGSLNESKKFIWTKPLSVLTTKGHGNKVCSANLDASKMQDNLSTSITPSVQASSLDNSSAGIKLVSFLPSKKEDKPTLNLGQDINGSPNESKKIIWTKPLSFLPTKGQGNKVCSTNPDASKMQADLPISITPSTQVSSVDNSDSGILPVPFLPSNKENKPDDSITNSGSCKTKADNSLVKKETPKRKKASISSITKVASLVFFDLETTGLAFEIGKSNVQITEVSMIAISRKEFEESSYDDLRDIRIIQKLCLCTRPRSKVSSSAAAVTGLSSENLLDQTPFERNAAEAINFFLSHLPKPVCLLAHNGNRYDFPLIKAEFSRLSMSLPSDILIADTLKAFRALGVPVFPPEKKICKSVKFTKKGQVSYSLSNLHLYLFNKNPTGSHSSEGDCIALAKVCHRMKDLMLLWIDENCTTFDPVLPMW